MARPRLIKNDETLGETIIMEPKVKQIIRVISNINQEDLSVGYVRASTVDDYLTEWIDKGYELFNTHFLGTVLEGHTVLYILVKKV